MNFERPLTTRNHFIKKNEKSSKTLLNFYIEIAIIF